MKTYAVTISGFARPLTIAASCACDAITRAIELAFNPDEPCPPAGLTIKCEVVK